MFDLIHKHKRLVQIIMALLILPFAFFGMNSYFSHSDMTNSVADLGGQKISQQEFGRALERRQDDLRRALGRNADRALLDNSEIRMAVLNDLVRQRILVGQALRSRVTITDAELQDSIKKMEEFQEDGKFSLARYEKILSQNRLTPGAFETSQKYDLLLKTVADSVVNTGFLPNANVDRIIRIAEQQREISVSEISKDKVGAQVNILEDSIRKYYDAHKSEFQVADQVRVEYVVFSPEALAPQVAVSEPEVKKYYDDHVAQMSRQAKRRASHILIKVAEDATVEAKANAKRKADDLLQQAKAHPDQFAELAKKYSDDIGSAPSGGDVGLFSRGMMVKPFDDAVFNMNVGDIVGPVATNFGFHIIKLTEAKSVAFEETKTDIEQQLKKQKAAAKFATEAENFGNLLWDQSDSLKPAADAYKLTVVQSPWLPRKGFSEGPLQNQKFLDAVFSDEVLKDKRNTTPIDVGSSTLIAGRAIDYKPAGVKSYEEVKQEIEKKLRSEKANKLVVEEGEAKLKQLQQSAQISVEWSPAQTIAQAQAQLGTDPAIKEAFRVDATRLPAFSGIETPTGYKLVKVTKLIEAGGVDAQKRKALAEQLQQVVDGEEFGAYLEGIKNRTKIKINEQVLKIRESSDS